MKTLTLTVIAFIWSFPSMGQSFQSGAAQQEQRYLEMERAQEQNQQQDLFHQQQEFDRQSAGYNSSGRSPYE